MVIPWEKQREVIKILTRTVERTRVEQGCISCHFYSDLQDKRGFMLEEIWETNDDFARHLRSDDFRNVLVVAETALEAPDIIFSDVIPGNGIEAIKKLRRATV
jgi:quinol monooxygenase YgiN